MSTYVTIGRNVDGRPMSPTAWATFKRTVAEALVYETDGSIVTTAEGFGHWEGSSEMAYVVVVDRAPRDDSQLDARLRDLAARYGQEAIAYAVAEVSFAYAVAR